MNLSTGRKTLLLTGAAGRLGSELIQVLGEDLDIIAVRHKRELDASTSETSTYDLLDERHRSAPVRTICCDLASEEEVRVVMRTVATLVPNVNYVVNAAGDVRFLGSTTDAHLFLAGARQQLDLNTLAPLLICSILFHEQWKHISVKDQDVSIINISSVSGSKPFFDQGQGLYAASKAATNMLTLHMASDFGKYGIRVNALCPDSFPSRVSTRSVAQAVVNGLLGAATGRLYKV